MHKRDSEKKKAPNKRTTERKNRIISALLIPYVLLIFYITLFAWNYGSSYGPEGPGGRNYNIVLFESIYNIGIYSKNFVQPLIMLGGDVLMFIPFGILVTMLMKPRLKTIVITTMLSFLLSSFIEISQFIFTYRVANVDDVLLNTAGGFIGSMSVILSYKHKQTENQK